MALLERQIIFKRKDGNGNTYMEFPVTKVECVDGAVLSVNNIAPDNNGNIAITSVTKATQDGSGNNIADTYATKSEVSGKASLSHTHVISEVTDLQTTLDAKAPLSSPSFKGLPKAPTATAGTNNTQIATTAFVTTAIENKTSVESATKATQDASGNVITSTYATKTELTNGLNGKSDTNHTHDAATTSALGMVKVGSNISVSSGTISLTKTNVTSALGYTPPTSDTVYTHPSYTAKSSGLYKVTVDSTGHVSATTAVTKADITGLGIPAQDTVYTLPNATTNSLGGVKIGSNISVSSGTISLTKDNVTTALGYTPPTQDTVYTHPSTHSASMITGLATVATSGKYSDLSGTPSSLPANGGNAATVGGFTVGVNVPANAKFTDTVYTLPNATSSVLGGVKIGSNISVSSGTISLTKDNIVDALGYTPSATNLSDFTLGTFGITATATELNYCDGVTSNIQTQLNGKANNSHTHDYLPLSGGNMTGSVAFGSTKGHGITWGTINEKTPYTGYCTQSGDGTFMVSSLLGTTYPTGLAIGGSSGNLLWKGNKVIDAANISEYANKYTLPSATSSVLGGVKVGSNITVSSGTISITSDNVTSALGFTPLSTSSTAAKATADASGNNIVNTYATKVDVSGKMNGSIHTVSERTRDSSEPTYGLS